MFPSYILNIRQVKICFHLIITYNIIHRAEEIPFTIPFAMITCLTTRLNHYYEFKRKTASHTNVAYTAIRNEMLYSVFVLPNVQIFFVQKIALSLLLLG